MLFFFDVRDLPKTGQSRQKKTGIFSPASFTLISEV